MSGGKGSGGGESSSEPMPWAGAEPYITDILKQAQGNYKAGVGTGYYPGNTYVQPGSDTLAAQAMTRNRALTPSPVLGAAENNLTQTLNGGFLGSGNPHFSAMADRVAGEVLPRISSGFGMSGRVGGSGYAEGLSRGLGDALAPIAYQNYSDERGRQMQGLGMAPGIEQAGYMPGQMMGLLGKDVEGYEQKRLGADMARFQHYENAPWDLLARYQQFVGPNSGFGQSQQSQTNGNLMGDLLGGAQTAAIGYSLLNGTPLLFASSRSIKHVGPEANGAEVLDALAELPVGTWRYQPTAHNDQAPHIGPYAEDFAAAFGVGDGTTINVIDAIGVLFAAVKELSARLDASRSNA